MPSEPNPQATTERGWSLTRRMALTFAFTTSTIIFLYALWSSYFVFGMIRGDMKEFMEHELSELALNIDQTDGSKPAIQEAVKELLKVSGEQPCAVRVRNEKREVVVEGGIRRLLSSVREPIEPDSKWREHLVEDQVSTHAIRMEKRGFTLEIIVDLRKSLDALFDYVGAALLTFLISVGLAALAGFSTAYRGLSGLRDVTAQARTIGLPTEGARIELRNAPSEIRDVGAELNSMLDRIQEGLSRIRTFTAGLAHELRSPLMNLIGETEVTLLAKRSPDEYEQLLRSNLEDLHYLSETVDNLVAFCHTNHPEQSQTRAERFDLAVEAGLRLESMKRNAARDGVEVRIRAKGDTTIDADREGCLRLLRNLVGNAITFSSPGTHVDCEIEGTDEAVRVVVSDQGPGVPPELGDKIFEPFVSGRKPGGKRSGYGLGLAICRSVIEDHGGTLGYVNLPTGGARFTAVLPRRSAS